MIYPYHCINPFCLTDFEVIKSVTQIDFDEYCPECKTLAERQIGRTHFYGASDWNRQEFNPAFGKVIKSKRDLQEELSKARDQGLDPVEIGTESVKTLEKEAEKTRQENRERRWQKVSNDLGLPL